MTQQFSSRIRSSVLEFCTLAIVMNAVATHATAGETLWVDANATASTPNGTETNPFRTIGQAVKHVRPGMTIRVRAGTYRESVRLPSGESERPIALVANEGEQVEISGADPISGWEHVGNGIYKTTVDWRPSMLLNAGNSLPISRAPNHGWLNIDEATPGKFVDRELGSMVGPEGSLTGSRVLIWASSGNVDVHGQITDFDKAKNELVFTTENTTNPVRASDRYCLENSPAWIDQPGEWAIAGEMAPFTLWWKPESPDQLANVVGTRRDTCVRAGSHARIERIRLVGTEGYGLNATKGTDIEVVACEVLHHRVAGINVRDFEQAILRENRVTCCKSGVVVNAGKRVEILRNDIGHNLVDGLLIVWGSREVRVEGNSIHHHLQWGHPDGIQIYRDVEDVLIRDNLILANGQSIHMQQCTRVTLERNTILGCDANAITLGRAPDAELIVEKNLLALSGHGLLNVQAKRFVLNDNILMTGHSKPLLTFRETNEGDRYEGDRNVFWNSIRAKQPMLFAFSGKFYRDLRLFQRASGMDLHSQYRDPGFARFPVSFDALEGPTSDRPGWRLRSHANLFQVGDMVEFNFDGIPRRIEAMQSDALTLDPPIESTPRCAVLANWASSDSVQFEIDAPNMNESLRLLERIRAETLPRD